MVLGLVQGNSLKADVLSLFPACTDKSGGSCVGAVATNITLPWKFQLRQASVCNTLDQGSRQTLVVGMLQHRIVQDTSVKEGTVPSLAQTSRGLDS